MPTKHLSIRIESDTLDRLDQESRRMGQSRSELAKTLLEEGLRMEMHPGIVFRPGPTGRRPSLAVGPDVWEIARLFNGQPHAADEALHEMTQLIDLTIDQLRIAMRYYASFKEEIDDWIVRVDEESDRAEAAWVREQEILKR